jgi:hypothetical protein
MLVADFWKIEVVLNRIIRISHYGAYQNAVESTLGKGF